MGLMDVYYVNLVFNVIFITVIWLLLALPMYLVLKC